MPQVVSLTPSALHGTILQRRVHHNGHDGDSDDSDGDDGDDGDGDDYDDVDDNLQQILL